MVPLWRADLSAISGGKRGVFCLVRFAEEAPQAVAAAFSRICRSFSSSAARVKGLTM